MDLDSLLTAGLAEPQAGPAALQTEVEAVSCGSSIGAALDDDQPAARAGEEELPLSQQQGATSAAGLTSPPLAPDCWAAWGLLQPSLPAKGEENTGCDWAAASQAGPICLPVSRGSCGGQRHSRPR